jgi:SAM-dependent methyltransferase
MTVLTREQLLHQLHQLGVRLQADQGQLAIQAPKGALTPALRESLAVHKAWLLATLSAGGVAPGDAASLGQPEVAAGPADRIRQRLLALPGVLEVDVQQGPGPDSAWQVRVQVDPPATGCTDTTEPSAAEQQRLARRWSALLWQGETLAARLRQARTADLQEHANACAALDRLAVLAMALTLARLGAFSVSASSLTAENIVQAAGLRPQQTVIIRQWLRVLAQAGHLQWRDGAHHLAAPLDLPALQQAFDRLQAEIASAAPYAPFVEHIKTCAARQLEMLRGTEDPFALLFPGGSFDVALAHYRDTPVVCINNAVLAALARAALGPAAGDAPPTVLELGAGCGATTEAVLAAMHDQPVRYVFTDVGEFFLRRAAQHLRTAQGEPLACQLLDLARSPLLQGIASQSVDLIVAVNVVHNASHIEEALRRLRSALKPGGLLLLSEQTENSPLNQINFAHFDSFGHYQDRRLEIDSPLMPAAAWMQAFDAAGYARCAAVPATAPEGPDVGRQRVLLAEAPAVQHRWRPERWMALAQAAVRDLDLPLHLDVSEAPIRPVTGTTP